jgi:RNA polymerase sigma factor (sigma-70 family)
MLTTEQLQNTSIYDLIRTDEKTKKRGSSAKPKQELAPKPLQVKSTGEGDKYSEMFTLVEALTGTRLEPERYFIHTAEDLGNWMRPVQGSDSQNGWNSVLVAGLQSLGKLNQDVVNEILSETALACIRSLPRYQKYVGGLNLKLIYGIMFKKRADYFRKFSRVRDNETENDLLDLVELSRAPNFTFSLILIEALESLPYIDQQVLLLKYWVGLDVSEVAQVVGKTYKGAESALSRGRAKLQSLLNGPDSET